MTERNIRVTKTQTNRKKRRRKYKLSRLIFPIVLIFIILFAGSKIFGAGSTIADGVSVCGVDLSGMTKKEAAAALKKKAPEIHLEKPITFVYKQEEVTVEAFELSPKTDISASVEKAYNYGKSGNVFSRFADFATAKFSGVDFEMEITLDYKALEKYLNPVVSAVPGCATPAEYKITKDGIQVIPGEDGNVPDYDAIYSDISSRIFGRKKGSVKIRVKEASYDDITAEEIYKKFHSEVKNAEYIRSEAGDIVVSPSSDGINFDVKKAQKILDDSDGEAVVIPIQYKKPDISAKDLSSKLFTDELSSYNSMYSVGDSDRNINVELSCSKMDGTQLLPGEVFSYVGAVGQGTYDEGYVDANIYANGQVMKGVAGGICQGSSTLYSAVLFADLEIVQRVNHSMPVGYVPKGMDATIAVPDIDFKFRNSTNYPLKISAKASGGYLEIRLLGYNETPEKEVEITNKLISTTPFKTKQVLNPDLADGVEFVKQNGTDGYVIETYKTIKMDGETVSTVLVSVSTYDPLNKIVEVSELSDETEDKDDNESEDENTEDTEDETTSDTNTEDYSSESDTEITE